MSLEQLIPTAGVSTAAPVPNAKSAARERRFDGPTGAGLAWNEASSAAPQKGHAPSLS